MACDFTRRPLLAAGEFTVTRDGVQAMLEQVQAALPADVALVRDGMEAASRYHLPLKIGLPFGPPGPQRTAEPTDLGNVAGQRGGHQRGPWSGKRMTSLTDPPC